MSILCFTRAAAQAALRPNPIAALASWDGNFLSLVSFVLSIQATLLREKRTVEWHKCRGLQEVFIGMSLAMAEKTGQR